ncbi:unnamed protein product [Agarophyton chilense]
MMDELNSKRVLGEVFKALDTAIRCCQNLPSRNELRLIQVTSSSLKEKGNQLAEQVVSELNSVASRYAVSLPSSDSDSNSSQSSGSLALRDSMFDQTAETTDEALQHFNVALDRVRKIKNAIVPPQGALGPSLSAPRVGIGNLGRSHGGALDIQKPQIHFSDYPIDNSDAPFVAPHARHQISDSKSPQGGAGEHSTPNVENYLQELYKKNSNPDSEQRHPYENEISNAQQEMSSKEFKIEQVTIYKSMKSTPCTFVTTEEELFNVAERLKNASSIAVDLENHSLRSFQGFTCLIQISTRKEDIVIDVLRLRGSVHRALAPIFTDETVVKVLHGADRDVQWLERDFGIYVVNMFDTGQAARLLKLPSASLAFLLTHFCDVSGVNKKKFQLADWRQRPLSNEMFEYARSDTHYLLYIYDRLRCELSKKGLLQKAWERSSFVSRKRHRKARFEPGVAKVLAARHSLGLDKHQIRLLEELCKWRDMTAREEDESFPYVAPLKVLFGIVRARDKARTVEGLLKFGFPGGFIPPLVYKNSKKLTELIGDALDAKLDGGTDEKPGDFVASETQSMEPSGIARQKKPPEIAKQKEHVLAILRTQTEVQDDDFVRGAQSFDMPETAPSSVIYGAREIHESTEQKTKANKAISLSNNLRLTITSKSRSTLFDSDSDSDSSDTGEHFHARRENDGSATVDGKEMYVSQEVSNSKDRTENEKSKAILAGRVENMGKLKEAVGNVPPGENREADCHQMLSTVAEQSIIDPGKNSASSLHSACKNTKQKRSLEDMVAEVKAEIAAEQEQLHAVSVFRVETDEVQEKGDHKGVHVDVEPVEELPTKKEEAISLRESARRAEILVPKKRKRKEKGNSAYDREKTPIRCDRFDPMRKLRGDWKTDGKSRVKKRRRGRGQSMSFRST